MGRYIDYEDLVIRYPLVKKWSTSKAAVESYLMHYAEGQCDELLSPAYSTPFSAGHPTVQDITFDLCLYKVLMDKDMDKAAKLWEVITARIDKLLTGEMQIATDSGALEPSGGGLEVWSNTKDYNPTHTMLGANSPYTRVDSSLQQDLENERL